MYKKILVPLDGSAMAEQILPHVNELAGVMGSEIELLMVVLAHTFPGADPTYAQVEVVQAAEKYLEDISKRYTSTDIKVSTHVRYGHAAEEILRHASKDGIDLVAMCSHGHTGIVRFVLGSVSKNIADHCSKPVLIIRAKE